MSLIQVPMLPQESSSNLSDIVMVVQGWTSPTNIGLSYYATWQQVLGLLTAGSNISLTFNSNNLEISATSQVSAGTANDLAYYATSGSVLSPLASANNGVLITSNTGVPSISSTLPAAVQQNITQLGTVTAGTWNASVIPLAYGGTSASLSASNGGIFYSTATAGAILAGTATANQVLLSGSNAAPSWSIATYPVSTTQNQLLYSSANNQITGLASVNSAILTTNASGVPTWSTTVPLAVLQKPQVTVLTSGSGTYTTPTGALYLFVEGVAGGGGGAGSGTSAGGDGGNGGNTTFGTSFLTANGGTGGDSGSPGIPGTGGTASGGDINSQGGFGSPSVGGAGGAGGTGGAGYFGGGGGGSFNQNAVNGTAPGSGGGGAGSNGSNVTETGAGGGAGGYFNKIITSPLSSYNYSVGGAGSAGTAAGSGFAGGTGAAGEIRVTAYFQ